MELILDPSNDRFLLYPPKYQELWHLYKKAQASIWTAEEIDLAYDMTDWELKLNEDERHFISYTLAFFSASDGIVAENVICNFYKEIQIPESRAFLAFQAHIENVHAEVYGMLIDTYIQDKKERDHLFHAIDTIPAVKMKSTWALKWLDPNKPLSHRLIAFICIEGIFFSGSFCSIFWLKKRNLMKGLTSSNEFISRDEGMHVEHLILLYKMLRNRLSYLEVLDIITDAITCEIFFISKALPVHLIGINEGSMIAYIKFVADKYLIDLGYPKYYNSYNPFDWMEMISVDCKTNFFESRVSEYKKASILTNTLKDITNTKVFTILDDF